LGAFKDLGIRASINKVISTKLRLGG